jgi:glycine/D-amino acid oxidase-like deaminating enzyme
MKSEYDVVICGAGIAGISAAYYLTQLSPSSNILLIDKQSPLSLTSDHSTECFRNWWPDQAMVRLMNRSISLMEKIAAKSNNTIHMNKRGYAYLTADSSRIDKLIKSAEQISTFGAGPLRVYRSPEELIQYVPSSADEYALSPVGADLLIGSDLIQSQFPGITRDAVAALHIRNAGWVSAQQLGMYMLTDARGNGVDFLQDTMIGATVLGNQVASVELVANGVVKTDALIIAAGPFSNDISAMIGIHLPVINELHRKAAMRDIEQVIDRSSPLLIWTDSQKLSWTEDEIQLLSEDEELRPYLQVLPSGVHTRPEGGPESDNIVMLWEFDVKEMDVKYPIPENPVFPDIVIRGLTTMLPEMEGYIEKNLKCQMDGGYYTKTIENRPLICELPVDGAFLLGALSGFGIMAACAAGELLARIVANEELPDYSCEFSLNRYQDPEYIKTLENLDSSGQL